MYLIETGLDMHTLNKECVGWQMMMSCLDWILLTSGCDFYFLSVVVIGERDGLATMTVDRLYH